jgi:uncharacterized protein (DUF58 family)
VRRPALGSLRRLAARRPGGQDADGSPLLQLDEASWQRFDRLALVSRDRVSGGLGGEHRSRSRAPSTDFVDHRAYQPGDDFRRVDWNVYGRLGTLQVKVTEASERQDVILVLDCSASMAFGEPGKLAYATRLAAALSYVALQRADVLRIVCLGSESMAFGPARGRVRFPEAVRFLSRVSPSGELPLAEALSGVLDGRRANALVIVLSDLLEPDPGSLAAALDDLGRAGADVALVQILSPQEDAPEAQGAVELIDAETGEMVQVGLSVEAVERYRARLSAWEASLDALAAERGLRFARALTSRPLESLLLDDLRRIQLVR